MYNNFVSQSYELMAMGIEDLFEVDKPFFVDPDHANGGGVFLFIRIGEGIAGGRVVDRMNIDGEDIGILVFLLFLGARAVAHGLPLGEDVFVGGVGIQVEGGFFVVAVKG